MVLANPTYEHANAEHPSLNRHTARNFHADMWFCLDWNFLMGGPCWHKA